jgi:hypothetical protein
MECACPARARLFSHSPLRSLLEPLDRVGSTAPELSTPPEPYRKTVSPPKSTLRVSIPLTRSARWREGGRGVGRANSGAAAQGEAGRRDGGLPTNGGDPQPHGVVCARNPDGRRGPKEKRTGGERSVKGTCEKATGADAACPSPT